MTEPVKVLVQTGEETHVTLGVPADVFVIDWSWAEYADDFGLDFWLDLLERAKDFGVPNIQYVIADIKNVIIEYWGENALPDWSQPFEEDLPDAD